MALIYCERTMVALILKTGVSQNANCDNSVGFPKAGHKEL